MHKQFHNIIVNLKELLFYPFTKLLLKKNEIPQQTEQSQIPEIPNVKSCIETSPFIPIADATSKSPLLQWVKEYKIKADVPSDVYIATTRDKLNQEVIVATELYSFKKRKDCSLKLNLFYGVGEVPSFMSIGYRSKENLLIIFDCRSQVRRRWHGSIMLQQLRELSITLNQIIDNINNEIFNDLKKISDIDIEQIPSHYFKGNITTIQGDVVRADISYENLIIFYTSNNALKDGRVYIQVK